MKIIFDCLGFSTASALVVVDGNQYHIGYMDCHFPPNYEFHYSGNYHHLKSYEIPTAKQVIDEYKLQLDRQQERTCINNEIVYAG